MISLQYFIQKLYHRCILFSIFFYKKSNSSPACRSRRLLAIFLLNTNTLSTKELNTKLLNTYSIFMEKWNELAKEYGLSIIKSFTNNRKKKLSELLEKFTQEEILETMFKIKNINFLLGRTDKSN